MGNLALQSYLSSEKLHPVRSTAGSRDEPVPNCKTSARFAGVTLVSHSQKYAACSGRAAAGHKVHIQQEGR